jgi:hypothetical protein
MPLVSEACPWTRRGSAVLLLLLIAAATVTHCISNKTMSFASRAPRMPTL